MAKIRKYKSLHPFFMNATLTGQLRSLFNDKGRPDSNLFRTRVKDFKAALKAGDIVLPERFSLYEMRRLADLVITHTGGEEIYKLDFRGSIFGRLKAVEMLPLTHGQKWLCRCSCGRERRVTSFDLVSKTTKSCGLC